MAESTFNQLRCKAQNHLDESGIGHDVDDRLNAVVEQVESFCSTLRISIMRQAIYTLLTNVPTGVMTRAEATPEHAIKSGLVNAIGKLVKWNTADALDLAADIAEDVNAHAEAAEIRRMTSDDWKPPAPATAEPGDRWDGLS